MILFYTGLTGWLFVSGFSFGFTLLICGGFFCLLCLVLFECLLLV